jgi:redox-sensitive bicupin YhaK (pirin superfamily)
VDANTFFSFVFRFYVTGIMHEEVPEFPGTDCHGLQMFVSLSEANELKPPRCFHINAADVPEVKSPGVRARVLCGESNGVVSPMDELLTPITLLDIFLEPGKAFIHPLPKDQFALAFLLQGEIVVNYEGSSTSVVRHQAIAFDENGDAIEIVAGSTGAQLLLGAGVPTGRPNVWSGPFCLSTEEKANDAVERYRAGKMGTLAASF